MALAPADFYAYSNATGVPVPEDSEERARMAPAVMEFRRNQLKAPESQGPDPLSVGIGLGLAAGALGAGVYGVRKFLQGRGKPNIPAQPGKSGVTFAKLGEVASADVEDIQNRQRNVNVAQPATPSGPTEVDLQQLEIPSVEIGRAHV